MGKNDQASCGHVRKQRDELRAVRWTSIDDERVADRAGHVGPRRRLRFLHLISVRNFLDLYLEYNFSERVATPHTSLAVSNRRRPTRPATG